MKSTAWTFSWRCCSCNGVIHEYGKCYAEKCPHCGNSIPVSNEGTHVRETKPPVYPEIRRKVKVPRARLRDWFLPRRFTTERVTNLRDFDGVLGDTLPRYCSSWSMIRRPA